ncbi:hypothetical protein IJF89_00345 [Candidatus Saccharibacteria bacterium]|nr:hypothetical protein [Candidatus Saccharibacteria bacterium]
MKTRLSALLLCLCLLLTAAPALANPSPTAEGLIAPCAYLSDEPVVFDEALQPLTALHNPDFTVAAYAEALGYTALEPANGTDLYFTLHRGDTPIYVLIRHDQVEVFYPSIHDNITKITTAYTTANAAKLLFYLATEAKIDATALEKSDLPYLPLDNLYMVELFAADLATDATGHLVEDNLTFINYMTEPRFYNYAAIYHSN